MERSTVPQWDTKQDSGYQKVEENYRRVARVQEDESERTVQLRCKAQ